MKYGSGHSVDDRMIHTVGMIFHLMFFFCGLLPGITRSYTDYRIDKVTVYRYLMRKTVIFIFAISDICYEVILFQK